jgi:hypothetical protein
LKLFGDARYVVSSARCRLGSQLILQYLYALIVAAALNRRFNIRKTALGSRSGCGNSLKPTNDGPRRFYITSGVSAAQCA